MAIAPRDRLSCGSETRPTRCGISPLSVENNVAEKRPNFKPRCPYFCAGLALHCPGGHHCAGRRMGQCHLDQLKLLVWTTFLHFPDVATKERSHSHTQMN